MRSKLIACLAAAMLAVAARAGEPKQEPAPPPKKPKVVPLDAWADEITYDSTANRFHLKGKVSVIKGDLRVNCREMVGRIDPKTRQIHHVIAVGEVNMITVQAIEGGKPLPVPEEVDGWRGKCSRADYDLKAGRLIMTSEGGDRRPCLWRAKGYVEADTIIFFPDRGAYELVGNPVMRGELPAGPAPKPGEGPAAP